MSQLASCGRRRDAREVEDAVRTRARGRNEYLAATGRTFDVAGRALGGETRRDGDGRYGRGLHANAIGEAPRGDPSRATTRRGNGDDVTRARSRIGARDGGAEARARSDGHGQRYPVWVNSEEDEPTGDFTQRRVWLGRHAFDIDGRYEPMKMIGRGAYGVVCSARDRVRARRGEHETVAIKKLTNCFDSPVEARRALREVHLLRRLNHENVIKLLDIMMPVNECGLTDDVYLVYELMDTDLHQIIRSKQTLLDEHCQYFAYQILRGLKYVHSAKVLHRDLKPSNILLNANCDLCICDFGLARSMVERGAMMTSYVVTRWYRAPELLLNSEEYAASIDVWSVGCILAEIIDRKPIFPGKDFIHQMRLIIETLGSPSDEDVAYISSPYARKYVASLPHKPKIDFSTLYPSANPLAVDLLERMLVFNPQRRISVDDALAHPYLASLHDAAAEFVYAPDPADPECASMDDPDSYIPDEFLQEAIFRQMRAMKTAIA